MHLTKLYIIMSIVFGLTTAAVGQDENEINQTIQSKAQKAQRAKFVDFCNQLGLPLASLDALGERIDGARMEANPVELATAARLLEAAEGAAGKKATLTAAAVFAEAVELAKERDNPAELRTIAKLMDEQAAVELEEMAMAAENRKAEPGERSRALSGPLTIHNYTPSTISIYIDGSHVGYVWPYQMSTLYVPYANSAQARDQFGNWWQARFDFSQYPAFYWPIHY